MRKVSVNLIGVGALLVSLAACGGTSGEAEPQVAGISGAAPAASAGAAGTSGEDVRQLPLGASQAEIDRAYDAYYSCWEQHGVPKDPDDGTVLLTWKKNMKKYQLAVDACADKEPLDPPELDPAQNPDYLDDLRAEKACMEGHGVKMEIRGTGKGSQLWAVSTKANLAKVNSPQGTQWYAECEIAAFTQK